MSARQLLLDRLNSLAILGQLHSHERYLKSEKALKDAFGDGGNLAGGFLRRPRARIRPGGSMGNGDMQQFDLVLIRGWSDEQQSQLQFDNAIDAVMAEFANQHRVGSWTSVDGDRIGFELMRNEPAMFVGVLVHYAVLNITLTR